MMQKYPFIPSLSIPKNKQQLVQQLRLMNLLMLHKKIVKCINQYITRGLGFNM
jgi:hypothetical protein